MKTLTLKTAIMLLLFSAVVSNTNAAIITVNPEEDVSLALGAASDGDIIELASEGDYVWTKHVQTNLSSFTIRAAQGLSARPVIKGAPWAFMQIWGGTKPGKVTLDGVVFESTGTVAALILSDLKNASADLDIEINNCFVRGTFSYVALCGNTAVKNVINSISLSNSVFVLDLPSGAVYCNYGAGRPKSVSAINCFFRGKMSVAIGRNWAFPIENWVVNHCTFDGNNANDVMINGGNGINSTTDLKNCIFSNNTMANIDNTTKWPNELGSGNLSTSALFNYVKIDGAFREADMASAKVKTNPLYNDFGFATAAEYKGAATDGNDLGFYMPQNGLTVENVTISTGILSTTVLSKIAVSQHARSFSVSGAKTDLYSVYSVNGEQVAKGKLVNNTFVLNATRGMYFLVSGSITTKFFVK